MADWLRVSIWFVASMGLAFIFLCTAIYDVKRVSPAQFWPWIKVKPEQLRDVRAYNQENCSMWMTCAFLFLANGIIGVFARQLSAVLLLMLVFPGCFFLIQRYNRILRKWLVVQKSEASAQ